LPDGLASWLTLAELARLHTAERIQLVMVRVWPVWQSVDWKPAVIARMRESDRWREWCAHVARADEAADRASSKVVVPPPAIGGRIFLRHWLKHGTSADIEMARRGFFGLEDLGESVARFFAFDVQRDRCNGKAAPH